MKFLLMMLLTFVLMLFSIQAWAFEVETADGPRYVLLGQQDYFLLSACRDVGLDIQSVIYLNINRQANLGQTYTTLLIKATRQPLSYTNHEEGVKYITDRTVFIS